jgi:hypothetical protein
MALFWYDIPRLELGIDNFFRLVEKIFYFEQITCLPYWVALKEGEEMLSG